MHTKLIGDISVAKILARFLEQGEQVALPFGDNLRYDLVLIRGTKAIRVQCKTARKIDGGILFNTISYNPFSDVGRGYVGEADWFATYLPLNGKVYIIDVKEAAKYSKGACRLRLDPCANNQREKIKWAKDYEY